MVDRLSARQQAFVDEVLVDDDLEQAAIRAGYDPGTIKETLRELLFEPMVVSAIAVAKSQRASRVKTTQDSVLHEMSLLALSCVEHYVIDDKGQVTLADGAPTGAMRAIQSIKRKVRVHHGKGEDPGYTEYDIELKLWDKPTPLKLMGRQVGLFPDRVEHTGKDGKPMEVVTRIERVIVDAKKDE